MAYQVLCVDKSDRPNPHEKIRRIGGLNANGTRWSLLQKRAIQGIESGEWQFYVLQNGSRADVIVASRNGNKYIKTKADGEQPNNLLSLPECP